ncbi:hypothetical protein [Winogradskyella costae]|uniref:hypothetical protein n=1 Tax=Winogradskyella costae TaxID=2697008 RepID=UPI0015CBC295|nr:hypothetical protein [Winogradskyella costae]
MKRIGAYIALAGILLIVLPYFNLTIMFLSKIDELGQNTALTIKIGLIIIGVILFFMDKFTTDKQ